MKKKIQIVIIVVLVLVALLFGAGWYMLNVSLKPNYEGRDEAASLKYVKTDYPWIVSWLDSLQHNHALRDTFIVAPDGARLHGYYVKASCPTSHTVLLVHGYTDNGIRMLPFGYIYHHCLGYNLLLPDLRNAGKSDGDHFQMGWKDRNDVRLWVDLSPKMFGDSTTLVVHGVSMGAATTMMLSGDSLPTFVTRFVEDCGYTSAWDEFSYKLNDCYGLPEFPILYAASAVCKLRYGWSFGEASAVKQVSKCRRPMLFIHGDHDTYVPFGMLSILYAAKPQPKEKWITKNVIHAMSYKTYPNEYTQKVRDFIRK